MSGLEFCYNHVESKVLLLLWLVKLLECKSRDELQGAITQK